MTFSMNYSAGEKGAGVIGGEPSGVYGRYNIGDFQFLDATVAWSYSYSSIAVTANYNLAKHLDGDFYYRYGIGATVGLGNTISVAARIPVGIEFDLENILELPLIIFADIAPGLEIIPNMAQLHIYGGAGFVYFF
ncbi:MAG: hypothetical protein ACQESN_05430 [Thermotogota bacterium]